MPNYRRAQTAGASYFFTLVTYRRRAFLCEPEIRSALRDAIIAVRQRHPFVIEAWVLLPDHLHAIWTLPPNDANFALRWAQIKRQVSMQCASQLKRADWLNASRIRHRESTLWQRRYWEHQIRDETDMQRHMDYLHFNPIKHGLVEYLADWPFSSFHRLVHAGVYSSDWGSSGLQQSIEDGFGE